ncbi:MAG: hypothetical protein M1819_005530 [Sarea resinae]|nr:MAG: hypothetical protein M1819_005530 [Sarea resinae]
MQHVLQGGLSAGMSATEAFHSSKPNPVDPSFDGTAAILPASYIPSADKTITLRGAKKSIKAPHMTWGAWPWGDKATFEFSDSERPAVKAAWEQAYAQGLNWIDTAQAYGSGESERIVGELIKDLPRDSVIIQDKWYVVPDNPTNFVHPVDAPLIYLKDSLKRLGTDHIDLYLVHGHIHPASIKNVAEGLAACVNQGLTHTVGVANYSAKDMLEMQAALAAHGIPLALNQCEYSVLRRHPETLGGLLTACRENGIVFQSYSSLAQGRLTGKYSADNPPPAQRRFSSYDMKDLEPTMRVLGDIAAKHDVGVSAVALNYNLSKGVIPTVGIRSPEQMKENAAALGWRLSLEEMKQIDAVSVEGKTTALWQQG